MNEAGQTRIVTGHYLDGLTARVREVVLNLNLAAREDDSVLILRDENRIIARWPLTDLRKKRDQANSDGLVLGSTSNPDARLILSDPELIQSLQNSAPNLKKNDIERGTFGRIFKWAFGAIAAVSLIVFVIVPAMSDQLAVLVPVESERKLGEASIKQISWALGKMGEDKIRFCEEPKGLAALNKMSSRLLDEIETDYDINIRVMKHPMENAFAVPGGQVVIFDGLLAKANTPEEIAGVLGHELGHVVNRDPTRLTLRSAGTVGILGMLVGDFTGGAFVLLLTERLIAASYAQDAETAADVFAYEVMGGAGLPTSPFGDFFDRMAKIVGDDDGFMSHLASHPNLSLRAANARSADRFSNSDYKPVLSDEEWADLEAICKTQAADTKPEAD